MARMLESEEAARRLGVKVTTLYAYVSRGLITSHPSGESRRSLFDVDDVENFAKRSRAGRRVETKLASVTTSVTQLRDDGPAYRGILATELASYMTFEEVAELLWCSYDAAGPEPDWSPARLPRPPDVPWSDSIRWAALMCGATDPLRSDLRPTSVLRNARKVISSAVGALAAPEVRRGRPSIADRLAGALVARSATPTWDPRLASAVDTSLVMLADHELATSTMSVRITASTRADLYDALLAGLATMAGPLHAGASEAAYAMLVQAGSVGAGRALDANLRLHSIPPGFGHTVYHNGDPRFPILMARFEDLAATPARELVHELVDLAAAHSLPPPNIDLAIAAIAWAKGLPPDAGRAVFTIARLAGWTAHYLEELDERALRFRARAVYSATPPSLAPEP